MNFLTGFFGFAKYSIAPSTSTNLGKASNLQNKSVP